MSRRRIHEVPPTCQCGTLPFRCGGPDYYFCRGCKTGYHLIEGELVVVPKKEPKTKIKFVKQVQPMTADEYERSVS